MEKKTLPLTMADPWRALRQGCFGNVEPDVELEAITTPVFFSESEDSRTGEGGDRIRDFYREIERMPAIAAGHFGRNV